MYEYTVIEIAYYETYFVQIREGACSAISVIVKFYYGPSGFHYNGHRLLNPLQSQLKVVRKRLLSIRLTCNVIHNM